MKRTREKRRTDNSSIRFDSVKYDSICKKEGLKTPQQVVDFLVDKYWWEDKIGSVPTLERQAVQVTNLTPETETTNKTINTLPQLPKVSQTQAYQMEIMDAKTPASIQRIVNIIKRDDSLTKQEQIKLEQFGVQRSREIDY